jgi:hypothetical protein
MTSSRHERPGSCGSPTPHDRDGHPCLPSYHPHDPRPTSPRGAAAAAVLTGARSMTAIAEWAQDAPQPVRAAPGARRDGRQVHLLAAIEHATRAVLAQHQVNGAPCEVSGLRPLLADLDLTGAVVTVGALQTHADAAQFLVGVKRAHYLFTIRPTSPRCWVAASGWPGITFRSWTEPATALMVAWRSERSSRSAPAPPVGHGQPAQPGHRHPARPRRLQPRRRAAPQRPRRHPGPAPCWASPAHEPATLARCPGALGVDVGTCARPRRQPRAHLTASRAGTPGRPPPQPVRRRRPVRPA